MYDMEQLSNKKIGRELSVQIRKPNFKFYSHTLSMETKFKKIVWNLMIKHQFVI